MRLLILVVKCLRKYQIAYCASYKIVILLQTKRAKRLLRILKLKQVRRLRRMRQNEENEELGDWKIFSFEKTRVIEKSQIFQSTKQELSTDVGIMITYFVFFFVLCYPSSIKELQIDGIWISSNCWTKSQVKICLQRQIFIPKAVKHLHIWCACY